VTFGVIIMSLDVKKDSNKTAARRRYDRTKQELIDYQRRLLREKERMVPLTPEERGYKRALEDMS